MVATRADSALLFGRDCRLPVAAWIRQRDKRFHQSAPPTFGTTSRSNINQELARLVRAGMLERQNPGDGKVWYEMTDSPLWEVVDTAIAAVGLRWVDERLTEDHALPA